jgi:hypothetical protein
MFSNHLSFVVVFLTKEDFVFTITVLHCSSILSSKANGVKDCFSDGIANEVNDF